MNIMKSINISKNTLSVAATILSVTGLLVANVLRARELDELREQVTNEVLEKMANN